MAVRHPSGLDPELPFGVPVGPARRKDSRYVGKILETTGSGLVADEVV
jgi:hypothetical protein